jgi:O-antigen ligase
MAVYDAAWSMFQERPLTGWTADGMYSELARRMPGYHLSSFYVHNTYLSLLIEFGVPGLVLYGILYVNLFRLGRTGRAAHGSTPFNALRRAWPILLCIYLFNAFFVDMAYQFVIGLVFTVAGMLCASEESAA